MKIGMIGLGAMGENVALNLQDHGIAVIGYAQSQATRDRVAKHLPVAQTYDELLARLDARRVVWIMVPDKAVDSVLHELLTKLHANDIIIEGGNSHFLETNRRAALAREKGIVFFGTGVSGGEQGARYGPCIMPGGDREAYTLIEPLLQAIAAKVDGEPCVAYIGPDGAGHFVKMVHNGIEYAMMQAIGEAYSLLLAAGYEHDAIASLFATWNKGRLNSYLIEITAAVVAHTQAGKPLLASVKDTAGQKGTGKWTSQTAYDLGVPVHSISAALLARILSSYHDERRHASTIFKAHTDVVPDLAVPLEQALYSSFIIAYAQGFALLAAGSKEYGYDLDFASIARIWRGGCIIRSALLTHITDAYTKEPALRNLMLAYAAELGAATKGLRTVVLHAIDAASAVPALSQSLNYYDGYRSARLDSAALIQGLRDYFGAHTYERLDKPGVFHTLWSGDGSEHDA